MRRWLLVERRNAHQAYDWQADPVSALVDEAVGLGRHDARLLRFFAGVHLDEARRAAPGALHLVGQSLRQSRPVDSLDDIESGDGVADLVGLQGPDQVQGEVGKIRAQSRIFCQRLLDTVFTESAVPGRKRFAHACRRMGFADGHQSYAVRRATRRDRRRRDPLPDRGEIGRDNPFHSSSIPGKDRPMPVFQYRSSLAIAASFSLVLAACGASPPAGQESQSNGPPNATDSQKTASSEPEEMDTEATLWTILGLAKKESVKEPGPRTGSTVSPILWQAAHDTLDFVRYSSEDPLTGSIVTEWYSPPDKPNERLRINVFILSRALHSDSLSVTVDRQVRSTDGQWTETTIARQVETDLETAILNRARQLKRAWEAAKKS